jgi:uncharacterized phage protein (TIGR02218 family)
MAETVINYQTPYTATSLIDYLAGRALETVVCWKLTPKMAVRAPRAVTWQTIVGVTPALNSLHCAFTGVSDFGSHGASSVETFTDEGRARFRRGTLAGEVAVGLSASDTNQHYTSIQFCWLISTVGNAAKVYESGTLRKTIALPQPTAVFSVLRLWNYSLNRYEVSYTVDDEVVYTSTLTPSTTLLVDTAFSGQTAGSAVEVELTQAVTAIGATSHSQDLTLPGHSSVTFQASRGGVPTTVDAEAGHESAGLQIESVFDDDAITKEAVEEGDWSGAKLEMFTVNLKALDMGQLVEFAGRVGRVQTEGPTYSAEARPLTFVGQGQVGRLVVVKCDVKHFADKFLENRCKLDPAATLADGGPITVTGAVTTATDGSEFVDSSRTEGSDYFSNGEVTFTSGPLAGRTYKVREYDSAAKKFVFRRAAPVRIGVGWTYSAKRGCPRTKEFCSGVANNIINHRGDPFISNIEKIQKVNRAA